MDDMNQQPFERQVANVTQRAVGPERHVEALAIARHARAQSRRRLSSRFLGAMQFAAGAAVVALFGAVLLMSGILDGRQESGEVGASPSATPSADATNAIEPSAAKVDHATGSFTEVGPDWAVVAQLEESGEAPMELGGMTVGSGEVFTRHPSTYAVESTDARLTGDAIAATATAEWSHTITTADVDAPRPDQDWMLQATVGRLRITNDEGTWEGTIGPIYAAEGEEPIDNIVDNAPRLFGGVPIVLIGRGGYEGLTAYIWPAEQELGSGFEALIVNSAPLSRLSEQSWAEGLAWLETVGSAASGE
jgi:hypothetical protein